MNIKRVSQIKLFPKIKYTFNEIHVSTTQYKFLYKKIRHSRRRRSRKKGSIRRRQKPDIKNQSTTDRIRKISKKHSTKTDEKAEQHKRRGLLPFRRKWKLTKAACYLYGPGHFRESKSPHLFAV